MVFVFDFLDKFLASDGAVLFFHLNNLHVLKEVRSYLESYNFQIRMKWAIVSSKDPSMKVLIQFFSCSQVSNFLHVPLLIVLSSRILQTLLSRVTLLVRDPDELNP